VVYRFSRGRSCEAPIAFLKDFRGHLQADAFPGYDVLYDRHVQEIGCWAHARRKFVEVTALMKLRGRAHQALAVHPCSVSSRAPEPASHRRGQVQTAAGEVRSGSYALQNVTQLDEQIHAMLPKSALGNAISYVLRNWVALCRYTEHGQSWPRKFEQ